MSTQHLPSAPRYLRTTIAAVAAAALAAGGLALSTAPATAATPTGGAQTAAPGPVHSGATGATGPSVPLDAGRYIVTLAGDPAAAYDGGVKTFAATKPRSGQQLDPRSATVTSYSKHLESEQDAVASSVGAKADYNYTLASNAFAADLTAKQAQKLSSDKRVLALEPDAISHPTAQSSTDFLKLSGSDGVWAKLGGTDKAGAGVVVGVVDTGIAPENPSFAGAKLGSAAGTAPYKSGGQILYRKADGQLFQGLCEPGATPADQFTGAECNTKLISARYYVDGFGQASIGTPATGEYVSPRDGEGHGSHTASTAAGNANVKASVSGIDFGTISGVAPAAKIAAYKACWSGPDPTVQTDDGCANSDLIAAIDQSVRDGVDVISFSIGSASGAASSVSAVDYAFLGAAEAGIFVSASGGNSGPATSTVDHAAPWETTVAASTIPDYEATLSYPGTSVAPIVGAGISVRSVVSAPSVYAADIGLAGKATPNLCVAGSLDPAKAKDKIVVCDRGSNARTDKSLEVKRAGGKGMILVNVVGGPDDVDNDFHAVPSIHVSSANHATVVAQAKAGATATLTPNNTTAKQTPVPQIADFSSRGPLHVADGDIIKPDIAAPGVSILADGANAAGTAPTFQFLSGTSMAAPHISGLAALYLGKNPTVTPAEIKSAIMTTAYDTVKADGTANRDVFSQGAGQVDPSKMFTPGLVYLSGAEQWESYIVGQGFDLGDPSIQPIAANQVNLPSLAVGKLTGTATLTRTVTARTAGTYTAKVAGLTGVATTVTPSKLTLAAGQSASFTVRFTRSTAALDAFATGYLTWSGPNGIAVRSPLAVRPLTVDAPAAVDGTGVTGQVDVPVTPGFTGQLALSSPGLSKGVRQADPTNAANPHSGTGVKGDVVDYLVSVPAGTALARFDLDAIKDTPAYDLDLVVYQLNAAGQAVAIAGQSATEAADERVDLPNPAPGNYVAEVTVFSGPDANSWDLWTTNVVSGGAPLKVAPNPLPVTAGQPTAYTASWSGLEPHSTYLGYVQYGTSGTRTFVGVTTGDGPVAPVNTAKPTITGSPVVGTKLTATPGTWTGEGLSYAYQWQRDGVDIADATAASYTVVKADAGHKLTVEVTATSTNGASASAVSDSVTAKATSTTTLKLSSEYVFGQSVTGRVKVVSNGTPASGSVRLSVDGVPIGSAVPLTPSGVAVVPIVGVDAGWHSVTAVYAGSDAAEGSTSKAKRLVVFW